RLHVVEVDDEVLRVLEQDTEEGVEARGRVVGHAAVDLMNDILPLNPEALAAVFEQLADERLGDRLLALGVFLGVLAPEDEAVLLVGGEEREQVEGERGLAEAAEPLEDEDPMAVPDPPAQAVQLGAAADKAGGQHAAGADVFERAARALLD